MTDPTPWKLRKVRRSSGGRTADVEQYNNRQHMICRETRPRYQPGSGAGGLRHATTPAARHEAAKVLPAVELAAYIARHHDAEDGREHLVNEVEKIILRASLAEGWVYLRRPAKPQIPALADLVIDQWLHPAKYWKEKEVNGGFFQTPKISTFAYQMGVSRSSWHDTWKKRFNQFKELPERWYIRGEQIINS